MAPRHLWGQRSLCAGLASGCLLPGVERRGEEAASRLPPPAACHLLAGTLLLPLRAGGLGWGSGRRAPSSPQPHCRSLLSSGSPAAPLSADYTSLCSLRLFLLTWACPRRRLALVSEGLEGRRQGDIHGGDQEALCHPSEAPPAASKVSKEIALCPLCTFDTFWTFLRLELLEAGGVLGDYVVRGGALKAGSPLRVPRRRRSQRAERPLPSASPSRLPPGSLTICLPAACLPAGKGVL